MQPDGVHVLRGGDIEYLIGSEQLLVPLLLRLLDASALWEGVVH